MTQRRTRVAVVTASIALFSVVPVFAQQRQPAAFVTGGIFAGIEQFSHLETEAGAAEPDLSGTMLGGLVGIGTFLVPRVSVRFELALRGTLDATESSTQMLAPGLTYTITQTYEDRLRTGSVLLAYHTRTGQRVGIEYLGGLGLVQEKQGIAYERTSNAPGFPTGAEEATGIAYGSVAVVGMDVPIAAAERLAIVPGIRAFASGSSVSIEPGVAVRWSF